MFEEKIVNLNVGGKPFATLKTTLQKFEGNLKELPEIQGESLPTARIFIDRPYKHFETILNFLRDGDVILPESMESLKELLHEAILYKLSGLSEKCQEAIARLGREPIPVLPSKIEKTATPPTIGDPVTSSSDSTESPLIPEQPDNNEIQKSWIREKIMNIVNTTFNLISKCREFLEAVEDVLRFVEGNIDPISSTAGNIIRLLQLVGQLRIFQDYLGRFSHFNFP
ncbi:BTB domain-containing protein [Caenorhabditis elegans]|uniref:BTB domain-containing protein n=1 Tax=Caenorhabditis elegans TaxID=6239 RepID=O16708_CAEEL|nr:BTB domain-containing protein [Caenorhabditis elegans]CCD68456.2 BTB domain-containing protein [Caenorhabditis elegans]